jgi:hypothetical protein
LFVNPFPLLVLDFFICKTHCQFALAIVHNENVSQFNIFKRPRKPSKKIARNSYFKGTVLPD